MAKPITNFEPPVYFVAPDRMEIEQPKFEKGIPTSPEAKKMGKIFEQAGLALKRKHDQNGDEQIDRSVKQRLDFSYPSSPSAPPPTPRKIRPCSTPRELQIPGTPQKSATRIQSPAKSVFHSATLGAKDGRVSFDSKIFYTALLGKGAYMNCYTVYADFPIVEGVSNDDLVCQTFNEDHLSKNPNFHKEAIQYKLENYDAAIALEISVTPIYHREKVMETGIIIRHRADEEIDIDNPEFMKQVNQYFKRSFLTVLEQEGQTLRPIAFDLKPSNLCIAGDKVILRDFLEKKIKSKEQFWLFAKALIQNWTTAYQKKHTNKSQTIQFINALTSGFETYGYRLEWNQEFFDGIVDLSFIPEKV